MAETTVIVPEEAVPDIPAPVTQPVALVTEADDYEGDSGIDAESVVSSTTSVGSSILKYREENGRTYHAYKVR